MKKILPILLLISLFISCNKDKDSPIQKDCAVVFYGATAPSELGGFDEHKMPEQCGSDLKNFIEYCKNQAFYYEIVYKGQTRKKCQYLVMGYIREDGSFNKVDYVRYVNGITPEIINYWEGWGYKKDATQPNEKKYEIDEFTGLEDNYPVF